MNQVGAYEAKTHLSRLLKRVSNGERITITRHGVPIAVLIPAVAVPSVTATEVIAALRKLRRGRTLDGESLRDLIDEGRR